MTKPRQLLGFEHEGYAWSWPEFSEDGTIARPGHAVGQPGKTACGAEWPHVWRRVGDSTGYVPAEEHYERMRLSEDRSVFLCDPCCRALRISRATSAR